MPYVTKADRDRALWLTLTEAIEMAVTGDRCSPTQAWHQLRAAVADEEIAWKWADQEKGELRQVRRKSVGKVGWRARAAMQHRARFWHQARIDGAGRVLDDDGLQRANVPLSHLWRRVLVSKNDVEAIWALAAAKAVKTSSADANLKTASQANVEAELFDIIRRKGRLENEPKTYAELRSLFGQRGKHLPRGLFRKVLRKPEFKEHRPRPGRPQKDSN